jgi:hypothetical protein
VISVTSSDVFLAAFVGCLFALAVVALAVWQALAWKARRFLKKSAGDFAGWIEGAADGDPEMRAELDKLTARRAYRGRTTGSPPIAPLTVATCTKCKGGPGVSVDLDALYALGWRMTRDGDFHCPTCVRASSMARAVCFCAHEHVLPDGVRPGAESQAILEQAGWVLVNGAMSCPACVTKAAVDESPGAKPR